MTPGYVIDIETAAEDNELFRRVLFTTEKTQLVLMSLLPQEDIGLEVHDGDQVLVIVEGKGLAVVGGAEHKVEMGNIVVVPAGVTHNVVNTGPASLKLFTLYAPPQHAVGTVHRTREQAERSEQEEVLRR